MEGEYWHYAATVRKPLAESLDKEFMQRYGHRPPKLGDDELLREDHIGVPDGLPADFMESKLHLKPTEFIKNIAKQDVKAYGEAYEANHQRYHDGAKQYMDHAFDIASPILELHIQKGSKR